jgi:hypothetical protein
MKPEETKKAYSTPRLMVYGNVQEITQRGMSGTDGGKLSA